jgi:Tol biopolymer transport system component
MGEVYRAHDTRLGRDVAIKVLAKRLATSEESRRRFEREARTISRLSHPHICTLFDVVLEGEVSCLVMELLEGRTLADRLSKGPLPLDEVLRCGAEIASALNAAHRKGIVHRDLKPSNVMLTTSGVKLLDFGLAKALAPDVPIGMSSSTPTLSHVTQEGRVIGTVPYMAPEQLEGKDADARSDIFALGNLLYEMATGRRAFPGDSPASIISAILNKQPEPISSVLPMSPTALDLLVRSCLAKAPEERWESAHDVELQLRAIAEDPRRSGANGETARPRRAGGLPWAVAAAAVVVGGAAFLHSWRPVPAHPATAIRFPLPPPPSSRFSYFYECPFFAISPDGAQLAYVASGPSAVAQLWVRSLNALEARRLPGTEDASSIFWSPDSRSLAFFTWAGKLKRLDLDAAAPVPVCDVHAGNTFAGTWGHGGDILFASAVGDAIYRVASSGGLPAAVVRPDGSRDEARLQWPCFLPDGRSFLFIVQLKDGSRSLVAAEPGRAPQPVMALASNIQYVDPGYIVFAREGALLGERFDWRRKRAIGAPFSIAEHVRYFLSTSYAAFTVSNGTVAYQDHDDVMRLVWIDRKGHEVGTAGLPAKYLDVSIAQDGKRALFSRARSDLGTFDIWTLDFARNVETRVTSDPDTEIQPLWLNDGRSIVYSAARGAPPRLFRRDLVTGAEQELTPRGSFQEATSVSPDGRVLAYADRRDGPFRGWTVPLSDEGQPVPFTSPASDQTQLRFSPDGRFIAFLSYDSGRQEVYVAPFPGPGERTRVSTGGATLVRWSRAGEILYLSADRRLMSVPARTSPSLVLGSPVALFALTTKGTWTDFDVSPDGQRALAIVPEVVADELPLNVVANWTSEAPK